MDEIKCVLEKRKKELLYIKKEMDRALSSAPEGLLRVNCQGKNVQYYHRKDSGDSDGVYLKVGEKELVRKLAQKEYDLSLIHI